MSSSLCTYADARKHLDDAVKSLRETIDAMILEAKGKVLEKIADAVPNERGAERVAEGICAPLREAAHRNAVTAWLVARAALVGIILRQNKSRKGQVPMLTRNRRARGTGKRKAFPSDSRLKKARKDGKRERYINRWLRVFRNEHGEPIGLPALALISEKKVGRPKVPREWRLYRRKVQKARQLADARAATARKRAAKGWKAYPRRERPKKKGWSDPSDTFDGSWSDGLATLAKVKKSVQAANVAELKDVAKARAKKWEDAH